METLGNAFHHFCAAAESAASEPSSIASRLLTAWNLDGAIEPAAFVLARQRLNEALDRLFPGHTRLVEWPVTFNTPEGSRSEGFIDLLLDTPDGWVIVDHKTFPGRGDDARERACGHAGQLRAYREALSQATPRPVLSTWIHFPILGQLMEIE